jgi:hypothetical protein
MAKTNNDMHVADESCATWPLVNGKRNDKDTAHHVLGTNNDTLTTMQVSEKQHDDTSSKGTHSTINETPPLPVVWLEDDDDASTQYSDLFEVKIHQIDHAVRNGKDQQRHHYHYHDLIIADAATWTPSIMRRAVVNDDDDSMYRHWHILDGAAHNVSMDFTEDMTEEIMDDDNEPDTHHSSTAKSGYCCGWFFSPKATKTSPVEWKTTSTTMRDDSHEI